MKKKCAAGCVIYRRDSSGALWLLLIQDRYGIWTVPKGHLDPGESEEQAAVREAFEETGIRGELGALVSRIEYLVFTKKGGQRLKQVAFFLLRADTPDFTLQADEGIHVADWLSPDAALAQVGYSQVHDVLAQALSML